MYLGDIYDVIFLSYYHLSEAFHWQFVITTSFTPDTVDWYTFGTNELDS